MVYMLKAIIDAIKVEAEMGQLRQSYAEAWTGIRMIGPTEPKKLNGGDTGQL